MRIKKFLNIEKKDTGEIMRKVKFVLLGVISIIVILAFIMPYVGRTSPESDKNTRIKNLGQWYRRTEFFISEKKRLPKSLYEVFEYSFQHGYGYPTFVVGIGNYLDEDIKERMKGNPDLFNQKVECEFVKPEQGWLIKERKPGYIYKKALMIDQDGTTIDIREN